MESTFDIRNGDALSAESDLVGADALRGSGLDIDSDVVERHELFKAHSVGVTSQRMDASQLNLERLLLGFANSDRRRLDDFVKPRRQRSKRTPRSC